MKNGDVPPKMDKTLEYYGNIHGNFIWFINGK